MSRFRFISIFDCLFLIFVILFITFAWVQFFVKQIFLSLFISLMLTLSVIFVLRWLRIKKVGQNKILQEKQSNFTKFKLAIQTLPKAQLTTLIKKLIPARYYSKTNKGDITFIKNNLYHTITCYFSNELTEAKLLELIKSKTADVLIVLCSSFTKDAQLISTSFNNIKIELLTIEQLYDIFIKNNIEIDTSNINFKSSHKTIKDVLKNIVSRDKSKKYFVTGLILLFTSLIVPFKIYYIVISSILFILSLFCRFKPTIRANYSIFD